MSIRFSRIQANVLRAVRYCLHAAGSIYEALLYPATSEENDRLVKMDDAIEAADKARARNERVQKGALTQP